MDRWPLFHNGAAAGLRVSARARGVDSAWLALNRPGETDSPNLMVQHGGMLLALGKCFSSHYSAIAHNFFMTLGLSGHLSNLGRLESFDYLVKGHELISAGVLLGVAASKRGSMDVIATKKVSLYI